MTVRPPGGLVKVNRGETNGIVGKERIDTDRKIAHRGINASQMVCNDNVGNRLQPTIRQVAHPFRLSQSPCVHSIAHTGE